MAAAPQASPSETITARVPKSSVRNRTSTPDGELTALPTVNQDASPPALRPASNRTTTPGLPRRRSEQSQHSQESLERLRRSIQAESQAQSSAKDEKKARKRGAGVLGFLALKEPSSAAWAQYAEAQKKAAAHIPGRSKADVLPGVSSQKLPDFVPRTNSKWDGLPESPKRSSRETKRSSKRLSTTSSATKQTNRSAISGFSDGSGDSGSRRRYGSISSKPARPESAPHAPSKRTSVQSQLSAMGSVKTPARPLTATTDRSGARGYSAVTPWDEPEVYEECDGQSGAGRNTFLLPPTPPPTVPEAISEHDLPELDTSEPQRAQYQTSPEQSPQTPPVHFDPEHGPSVADPFISPQDVSEMERLWTFWHSDTDTDAEVPRAGSPSVKNFSRPIQRQHYGIAVQDHAHIATIVESEDDATETDGGKDAAEESDESTPRQERPDAFSGDEGTALTCDTTTLDAEAGGDSRAKLKTVEEDDDELKMAVSLRDAKGRTSPFVFERERIAPLVITPSTSEDVGPLLNREISSASRTTTATDATDSTVNAQLQSTTSSAEQQESTMPSTPGSMISTATARRRPSLMSIRSQATSLAPSDISEQWKLSPKQRLGLGGMVVRKGGTGAMPWEVDEGVTIGRSVSRASVLGGVDGSKLKRLSLRLGRK